MKECLFCSIVSGKIPCAKVYESDKLLAFLDINPMAYGHTLLITKEHFENVISLPASFGNEIVSGFQLIGQALLKALKADGFNVLQNNLPASGQEIFHVHWHLIPRFDSDGLKHWPQKKYSTVDKLEEYAILIGKEVNRLQ